MRIDKYDITTNDHQFVLSEVKVVFEPDRGCYDSIEIDGVDGFGYSLVCEVDD